MGCPVCKRLERTFEGWNTECIRARSSLYSSVSSRFAAYDVVEMERARSELQMHRSVCVLGLAQAIGLPSAPRSASKAADRKSIHPARALPLLPEKAPPQMLGALLSHA
jgi:hypothetical protein